MSATTSLSVGISVPVGYQALLDPRTGGYASRQVSRDLSNAVYVRIVTPRGSYWDDPTLGSKLYLLQREKDLPNRAVLAREYIAEALQPLLDAGRADDIQTVVQQLGDGRLRTATRVLQGGRAVADIEHFVTVQ